MLLISTHLHLLLGTIVAPELLVTALDALNAQMESIVLKDPQNPSSAHLDIIAMELEVTSILYQWLAVRMSMFMHMPRRLELHALQGSSVQLAHRFLRNVVEVTIVKLVFLRHLAHALQVPSVELRILQLMVIVKLAGKVITVYKEYNSQCIQILVLLSQV
jgi:hypothetical protein